MLISIFFSSQFIAVSIDSRPDDYIELNEVSRYVQLTLMTEKYHNYGIIHFYEKKLTRGSMDAIGIIRLFLTKTIEDE